MKLNSLTLQNFRCFEHLELDLHPQLTVLIAENGGGKTAVLDAMRVILSPILHELMRYEKRDKLEIIRIENSDVRLVLHVNKNMEQKRPCITKINMDLHQASLNGIEWLVECIDSFIQNNIIKGDFEIIQKYLQSLKLIIDEDTSEANLPLIRCLGTGRVWRRGVSTSVANETTFNQDDFSRFSGYFGCLSSEVNFSEFASWFGWVNRSYREEQMEAQEEGVPLSEDGKRFLTIIKAIQGAVDSITKETTGWHSLQYRSSQNKQLVMRHDENGFIPVEMLSDGIRNTIAMVADIAYRACKLNPHLGENAAKETDGVVLIDEVDMFLHPKWQQTILKSLTDAFPKMQFIVTTHSPQVLSTVRRENIRVLPEGKIPLAMTYGEPSGYVMHGVMGVDPQPPISEKRDLQQLTELVDQGEYENPQALEIWGRLKSILGEKHPQLLRLERSKQRQEMLKKMV